MLHLAICERLMTQTRRARTPTPGGGTLLEPGVRLDGRVVRVDREPRDRRRRESIKVRDDARGRAAPLLGIVIGSL